MISIDAIPVLCYDVAAPGSCSFDETAGPVCYTVGVIAGIAINTAIH